MSEAAALVAALAADDSALVAFRERAARLGASVAFCEAEDPRIAAAAIALRELGLVHPVLVGDPSAVRAALARGGADAGRFDILAPEGRRRDRVAAHLFERRSEKGMQNVDAQRLAGSSLYHAAGLVGLGAIDALVAGSILSTTEVMRAALWCVGPAEGVSTVSGSFLMVPPGYRSRPLLFADSAVVIAPDEDALVEIGLSARRTWLALFGEEPAIAALSFSTRGSGPHELAERMARVAGRLREAGCRADGELQVDAALVPEVAATKAPGSPVAGRADILLFPDLQSGNIGYKLVQRLAGWRAVGPLVQGLARPVFDLSRGCSAQEIVDTAVIAALVSAEAEKGTP